MLRPACISFVLMIFNVSSYAAVITYTDEAAYLAKIGSLAYGQWSENFEGGAWSGIQTTVDMYGHRTYQVANTATSQNVTWQTPYWDAPITTEGGALTAVTRRQYDDALTATSATKLYGVGGWFTTPIGNKYDEDSASYIPNGHVFVNWDGGAINNFGAGGDADPYKLINGLVWGTPRFFGVINTAGFNSVTFWSDLATVNELGGGSGESSEAGYYGPILYLDNVTYAAVVPLPAGLGLMGSGLLALIVVAQKTRVRPTSAM